jgi:prepilin-type N-terminal cleavage/methylation domain-containing protein
MKFAALSDCRRSARHRRRGFTLMEMLIATGITSVIAGGAMMFMFVGGKMMAGLAVQTAMNDQASDVTEFVVRRVRRATSVSTSSGGNILQLGFDDNYTQDSNKDGSISNDRDHYESFEFLNPDGNSSTLADNQLVYRARTNGPVTLVLVPNGIEPLPRQAVFAVTNRATVLFSFKLADGAAGNGLQGCDIRTVVVARNRTAATNTVTVIPLL